MVALLVTFGICDRAVLKNEIMYNDKTKNRMKNFINSLKQAWRKYFVSRSVASATYEGQTMTVTWDDGTVTKYEGNCTVWHKHPYMERCSTSTEYLLCDLWSYINKWKGSYPDAHKHCG